MPRLSVTLTAAFQQVVRDYQELHDLPSLSAALLQLAAKGYEAETGEPAPTPNEPRGGWRGSQKSLENLIHYVDKLTDKGRNDPTE